MQTVIDIVETFLMSNGYDGLKYGECSCHRQNIGEHCSALNENCVAAVLNDKSEMAEFSANLPMLLRNQSW